MTRFEWSAPASCLTALACVHFVVASGALHHSDFDMIYATAVALQRGQPAYEPTLLVDGVWMNMNPPQLNLVTAPLALVSLPVAATIFRLANLLALLAATFMALSPRQMLSRRGGWLAAAAISSPALVMQTGAGQVAGLLGLLAVAGWRALVTRRWAVAGVSLGALCALKPIFAPVLVWLLFARQWKPAVWAIGAGTLLVGLSVMMWGAQPQRDWLRAIGSVTWFDSRFNMGWVALASRLRPEALSYRVVAAVSLLLGVLLAAALRNRPAASALLPVLSGSIVAAPLGWLYYLCVPGPLLMRWAYDRGRWPVLAWLLWVPLPLFPSSPGPWWMRVTLLSVYMWGMLSLSATLLLESRENSSRR